MTPVVLVKKQHRSELKNPGDYCVTANGKVILACAVCGFVNYLSGMFFCHDPLTVTPSLVDHPCGHHYIIDEGTAK